MAQTGCLVVHGLLATDYHSKPRLSTDGLTKEAVLTAFPDYAACDAVMDDERFEEAMASRSYENPYGCEGDQTNFENLLRMTGW